jgi:hypothetical protein
MSVVTSETLHGINYKWFESANKAFIRGDYKYLNRRRIWISKPGKTVKRPLIISNPHVKIIEKVLLNSLEPDFEGIWVWSKSFEKEINTLKELKSIKSNENYNPLGNKYMSSLYKTEIPDSKTLNSI